MSNRIPQQTVHVGNRPRGWQTVKTGLGTADGTIGGAITMSSLFTSSVSVGISNSIVARVAYPVAVTSVTTSPFVILVGFNEDGTQYGTLPLAATAGIANNAWGQTITLNATNDLNDGTNRYSLPYLYLNLGYTKVAPYLSTAANTNGDETTFTLEIKPVSLEK
jgi:hypothetical protein